MSDVIGDWDRIGNILNPQKLRAKIRGCASRVGNYGASEVKKGIVSGAPGGQRFVPLSSWTISKKGSSKPLINHGDLVGSVTYQVLDDNNSIFIGVKKGKEANIAAVHEFGCTIKVTPKMRAFLHYEGIHLRKETSYIHIPARPFLNPVLKDRKFLDEIGLIYMQALKEVFMS